MYQGKDCPGNEKLEKTMTYKLWDLNKFLIENKFLAGEKITYPDFLLHEITESIHDLLVPILDLYTNLKRHFETISELPAIKKYKAERESLPYNGRSAKLGSVVEKK